MNRRRLINASMMTFLGLVALPGSVLAQEKSEQLLGAWNLVSIDYVRADGSRSTTFGDNPNGVAFFDHTGHFIIAVTRSDRAAYAVNDRTQGTAEENKATAQGTITYFGTYTASESDRIISIHIVNSSFPNWKGTNQKRLFTITGDELKLTNPQASIGQGTTEVVFKRAK